MPRNPELDRLKTKQQSLFEQKQAAFQRFKDLQERINTAHDIMQSAWDERVRARECMNREFEARQSAYSHRDSVWDEYGRIRDYNNSRIESLKYEADAAVASLVKQYYLNFGASPKTIILPFELDEGDLIAQFFEQEFGRKTILQVPKRGDKLRLLELANCNAAEEAERVTTREEKSAGALLLLGKMLSLHLPDRIESYDISNISGTDIVASMVVYKDGKPKKSDYNRFRIEGLCTQDDYGYVIDHVTQL